MMSHWRKGGKQNMFLLPFAYSMCRRLVGEALRLPTPLRAGASGSYATAQLPSITAREEGPSGAGQPALPSSSKSIRSK